MIRCLCTVLYLAQSLMDILRCLTDGLCKQLICHKMRAGTGCQKSAVLYKTHCTEIDLTVSLDGIFTELLDFVNAGGSVPQHQISLPSPQAREEAQKHPHRGISLFRPGRSDWRFVLPAELQFPTHPHREHSVPLQFPHSGQKSRYV